jgi:hypothetical protein
MFKLKNKGLGKAEKVALTGLGERMVVYLDKVLVQAGIICNLNYYISNYCNNVKILSQTTKIK